jgi:hypothetical protein
MDYLINFADVVLIFPGRDIKDLFHEMEKAKQRYSYSS